MESRFYFFKLEKVKLKKTPEVNTLHFSSCRGDRQEHAHSLSFRELPGLTPLASAILTVFHCFTILHKLLALRAVYSWFI
jgi:hypothetical protein